MENGVKSGKTGEDDDTDLSCGIGSWRPQWLQRFASPKVFLINFSLVAIFQGASFTYLIGSMTTLEKRYGFESKISGFILIADNISQMVINPLIGYLGSKYNRPMIMAIGELIVALACFISSVPYFIYGPNYESLNFNASIYELCEADREPNCDGDHKNVTVWTAVIILWFASFINGLGYTAFYTVGLPYLDDNTSKKNSPMYLSFTGSIRLLGPSLGFLLSSYCLSYFENPLFEPDIERKDPRWVGAWWIGFIVIGTCIVITSLPMLIFPTHMTSEVKSELVEQNESSKVTEQLVRVMKNPIFVFNVFGMCFRLLGYLGYYLFKPKYIEAQFQMSASKANFWTGFLSIPTMAIGIMAGGIFLSKFRPNTRKIVIYIFAIDMFTNLAIFSVMFLKCDNSVFPQTSIIGSNLELGSHCNQQCHCSKNYFQPVCGDDKVSNYFSPCYAGCSNFDKHSSKFRDCSCLESMDSFATNGYCESDCNLFPYYIGILGVAGVIMSTAKVGDTLLLLRCVEPRDKNFAMGIVGSFLAVLTFIPYPLVFGTITDMACIVWKESCGKTGNCWLYDIEKFRYYLHLSSFGLIMIGTLFVVPVIFYAKRINNMFEEHIDRNEVKLYELGTVNNGYEGSHEDGKRSGISVAKIITNLVEEQSIRKESLKDYELVHRRSSFVAL